MLPKAFPVERLTYAFISVSDGLLVVDAGSASEAEDLICLLRRTLGSFIVEPLVKRVKKSPTNIMTRWLRDAPVYKFAVGWACHLREPGEDGRTIKAGNHPLDADEIQAHIDGLDNEFRVPFQMYQEGYKYKEIAEVLALSIGTVKSRIFFTRKKLMKNLSEYKPN